jgi:predicted membrane-bound dolichyl-phosphate-mannose-protein mannosyltransferase
MGVQIPPYLLKSNRNLILLLIIISFFTLYSASTSDVFILNNFNSNKAESLIAFYANSTNYFYNPSPWTSVNFTIGGNNTADFVSDAELYAISGWEYIHGLSPNIINPEHPPLAKYFIGLSEIIFTNPSTMSFIFSILTIIIVYLISREILGDSLMTLLKIYCIHYSNNYS